MTLVIHLIKISETVINRKPPSKMTNYSIIDKMRLIDKLLESWLYSRGTDSKFQQYLK